MTICAKKANKSADLSSCLFAAAMLAAVQGAWAEEIVDLEGQSQEKSADQFESAFKGKVFQNGTVQLTGALDKRAGAYTIGAGATVNSEKQAYFNGDYTFSFVDGGTYNHTGSTFAFPFRYGSVKFLMDNGRFVSTSTAGANEGGAVVNFGYVWNNQDSSKNKNISTIVRLENDSLISLSSGDLQISGSKREERTVASSKTDFTVEDSAIKVLAGQIRLSHAKDWLSNEADSYVNVYFGEGADITCRQIYALGKYPMPAVEFNGATIRYAGSNKSFIGQDSSVLGDIYTIGEKGLTVDIPSGQALVCDGNSSALTGSGGIVKIGEGSITWNSISASGSKKHVFAGPLHVKKGTWSSSAGYAASSFIVEGLGSELVLSGVLSAENIAFAAADGGILKLSGATTPNDASPDASVFSGGVLEDIGTDAAGARVFGTLSLAEGSSIRLAGGAEGVVGLRAMALAVSATEANPVSVKFTSPADIAVGTYAVLTISGEGTLAREESGKFVLEGDVPANTALSVSADGKSLLVTVPSTNPATWTGAAGDGKFSTPGNWLGGRVPGSEDRIDINAASEVELDCDIAIGVGSIAIHYMSARVTIGGKGSVTVAEDISNASEFRLTVDVPVLFKSGNADAAVDVTGDVEFAGGVTGTVPVNHTTFRGDYVLSATSWTLPSSIALAAGSTVTASEMVLYPKGKKIKSEAGSKLTLKQLYVNEMSGSVFDGFYGELVVPEYYVYNPSGTVELAKGFHGLMRTGWIRNHTAGHKRDVVFAPETGAAVVMGGTGFEAMTGWQKLGSFTVRSSGDWTIKLTRNNYSYSSVSQSVEINSGSFDIDTSSYGDPSAAGHTVTVVNSETKFAESADYLLKGAGAMSAFGNGTLRFNSSANFTGGLTASNGVTVTVNKGIYPGKGNVVIKDTATLDLAQSASGTVPVSGTLTMEGGSVLRIPELSASVLPISVGALAFDPANGKKISLNIEGGALSYGCIAVLKSAAAIPADAWENFDLALGATLPDNVEPSFVVQGNALCIVLKGPNDAFWTGEGTTVDFSDGANWLGGQRPSNGANLHIVAPEGAILVNDIEGFSPSSITFSSASSSVTIGGDCAIEDIGAITNHSSVSHTVGVPVHFKGSIAVVQKARGYKTRNESHIVFAGGAYAKEGHAIASWDEGYSWAVFGNYVYANGSGSPYTVKDYKRTETDDIRFVVGDGASLYVPFAGDMREIEIRPGSVVNVGEMKLTASGDRVTHKNLGEIAITNLFVTGSGDRFLTHDQEGSVSSVFRFMSVTNDMKTNWFYFSDGNKATEHVVYVGEHGLGFTATATGAYCIGRNADGNAETIRPWYSDFTIANCENATAGLVFNRDVTFCTDDEKGVGRTITIDAVTRANLSPSVTVSGSGTLKVNRAANNSNQPAVSVTDTATLAYSPGASLGTGATSVGSGATLRVAESGTVAPGGVLTLKDGACLEFYFTRMAQTPVLALGENALVAEGGIKVKISVPAGKRPSGKRHVLTTGAGLSAGASVSCAENPPDWVLGVGVENGEIYANIKPSGMKIVIR